ncbi:acyl-CoA carboxylase subunit epsilon [Terrabacter sp. BE26]|uniref:acyl-CoA carboxylase subunit epsilon n=1 Tax=Terrabacter sp. BE26 TaxID=2898152 RepID=UPI0035BE173F
MSGDPTQAPAASSDTATIHVSGSPTPEELAALVVVLSALGDHEAAAERMPSPWSDPSWQLVGPSARSGGWRSTGLPR